MSKPRGLSWLEEQTGQELPYDESSEPSPRGRHLSVRLDGDLAAAVEALAATRGLLLSEYVRRLLVAAVEHERSSRAADADALLQRMEGDLAELRRRLAS